MVEVARIQGLVEGGRVPGLQGLSDAHHVQVLAKGSSPRAPARERSREVIAIGNHHVITGSIQVLKLASMKLRVLKSIINAPTSPASTDRPSSWQLLSGAAAIASNQHTRCEIFEKNRMLLGHVEITNGHESKPTVHSMLKDVLGLGDRLGFRANLQVEADNKHRLDHPSRAHHVHNRGRTAAPSLGHREHGHAKRKVANDGHLAHAVDRRGKHGIAAQSSPGIAEPNRRVLRNIGLRNDHNVQLMLTHE